MSIQEKDLIKMLDFVLMQSLKTNREMENIIELLECSTEELRKFSIKKKTLIPGREKV